MYSMCSTHTWTLYLLMSCNVHVYSCALSAGLGDDMNLHATEATLRVVVSYNCTIFKG